MLLRILASVILLFSVLFAPFWVTVILALICMAYFPFFLEAVFLLLLSDLLYGAPEMRLFNTTYVSFILTLIFFIIFELLKKKIRYNQK
ncbi:MAG: hypothetical protein NTZ87_01635 [Candidatus Nomurabacteria bacterium]|nr:hypothetical protein [Candidatus Nomurabacteria bacterium]